MSDESMHELAARLSRGEEAAFAELYDLCGERLYRYLAARHGADGAADLVQSAFLRAVKSRRRFRGVENPVAYLFQIARNEAARAAKRAHDVERTLPSSGVFEICQHSDQIANAEVVVGALGRLDGADRELVELKIFGGLSFREMAEVTGLPQGTVATRYRRALESLRGWLTKQIR
jgi:RNA polymerase sigma-70 factor (ECF subfamily)